MARKSDKLLRVKGLDVGTEDGAVGRSPVWDLLGMGREMFAELGGGEEFLRRERAAMGESVDGEEG